MDSTSEHPIVDKNQKQYYIKTTNGIQSSMKTQETKNNDQV